MLHSKRDLFSYDCKFKEKQFLEYVIQNVRSLYSVVFIISHSIDSYVKCIYFIGRETLPPKAMKTLFSTNKVC